MSQNREKKIPWMGSLCVLLSSITGLFLPVGRVSKLIAVITIVLAAVFLLLFRKQKVTVVCCALLAVLEALFLITNSFATVLSANLLLLAAGAALFAASIKNVEKPWRKGLLCLGSALFLLIALGIWGVQWHSKPITRDVSADLLPSVTLDEQDVDSSADMLREIETMNAFGSRVTGSAGHSAFITWLQSELESMGLTVYRDTYSFDRWEEKACSLTIGKEGISLASSYPYSGETGADGITAELVYTDTGHYEKAAGKIAVVEINNFTNFPLWIAINVRDISMNPVGIPASEGDLTLTSTIRSGNLDRAKTAGVQAVVFVMNHVSDEKLENQYLPFLKDYQGIPAVWLGVEEGQKVIQAAQNHASATLVLDALVERNAPTESFYVVIPGKNDQECILVNTHTDGVNVVEENGPIAMLSMIRYLLRQEQPERTVVFLFVTGHFRLPVFKNTSQATSTWLSQHPEFWDGAEGHRKAVAGLTVEHLGALEWKDNASGRYEATGEICLECVYAGNETMEAIWREANASRTRTRSTIVRGHNGFNFGESQPLLEADIPMVGFLTMPDYLLVDSESREMDKFDIDLMHEQTLSLLKALLLIDGTPTELFGHNDPYSYLIGNM